ncbi:aldo/keto reductase [Apiospora saccharicola]|uniref:protein-ribulosamine 3-kinase n=1 Tax=Apiospora saccharicola TaxID=335842 RepID=A0ABR1U525_9PEZI
MADLDEGVVKVLPSLKRVLEVKASGESAWAKATRVDVEHEDGSTESYFMKVSKGLHGRESLKGEFESTSAIYAITPQFCPKPIAWGTFESDPDSHFYICKFYDFVEDELPAPKAFGASLAKLHSSHTSPSGQFGFHVVTYNGDLPQDNSWSESWEAFFLNGVQHVLRIREQRGGKCSELDDLLPDMFEKVIPRLLRPLETGGNHIEPSLVHGDLWCGNAAMVDEDTEEGIIYDPSSFWGHNELIGQLAPGTQQYFNAYHAHCPKSAPEEDYDDRNALYAMVIEEMRRLIEKFPNGYEGSQPRADILRHQQLNSTSFNVNTDKEADGGEQPVSQDFHSLVSGEVYTSQVAN